MKLLCCCAAGIALFALLSPAKAEPAKGGTLSSKLKEFDADGDGKLSADERAAMKTALADRKGAGKPGISAGKGGLQQQILTQFDTNGNGKLDPDEQVAARKAASERRKNKKANPQGDAPGGALPPDGGLNQLNGQPVGGGGGGGAGPPGDGRAKLLERFDLNRDGQLSPEEMARAKEMMQKMGGPGGFGGNLPPGIGQQGGRPNVKPPKQFKQ